MYFHRAKAFFEKTIDTFVWRFLLKRGLSANHEHSKKYGELNLYPSGSNYLSYIDRLMLAHCVKIKPAAAPSIVSLGSCFSESINICFSRYHSVLENCNTNCFGYSADFGRIASLEQLVRLVDRYYSSNALLTRVPLPNNDPERNLLRTRIKNLNSQIKANDDYIYIDCSREHMISSTISSDLESQVLSHISFARKALKNASHIFVNIGDLLYFQDFVGNFFPIKPHTDLVHMWGIKPVIPSALAISSYVEKLQYALGKLKDISPDAQILLTVAPVPLYASFSGRASLVDHWYAKSILISVFHETCRRMPDIHYLPIFESVYSANRTSLRGDLRHVKHSFLVRIMRSFDACVTGKHSS